MTFQPAPDCAEVIIDAIIDGKSIANVLNFHIDGGYTTTNLQDLVDAVAARVASQYQPMCSSSVVFATTRARGLANSIDTAVFSTASAGTGTASGSPVPANVSLCATLRTANTGRSARGRFYAFPSAQSFFSAVNTFSTGYRDALTALLEGIQSDADAQGWTLSVLSRHHLGVARVSAVAYPVTAVDVRNGKSDSQRNRLPRPH